MPRLSTAITAPAALVALVLLAACGTDVSEAEDAHSADTAGFPVTVENCGERLTFDAPPERVMLLESASVTTLDGIGVLDSVVARAGSFPDGYYDDDLARRISEVPSLSEDLDASGHLAISQEEIIAQTPDLVLGLPDGVSRESLADAGIATVIQELYCPTTAARAEFEILYDEVRRTGEIFGVTDAADALVADLQNRVAAVEKGAVENGADEGGPRTAAVLYPSVGGGPLYAYGTGSMAQPQLEAAGLENVFDDTWERVVEIQTEELVGRDPDVLVLLYQGDERGVEDAVVSLPGAEKITAVRNGDVLTQLFNFTEPASPLVVDGLERIAAEFRQSEDSEDR